LIRTSRIDRSLFLIIFFLSLFFIAQVFRAEDVDFALRKIDGFIVAGFATFLISRYGYIKYEMTFLQAIVFVGIFVLFLTILYKMIFGFWSRDVRFFLNGPIIFGWLMSIMGLISVFIFLKKRTPLYLYLIPVFLTAIIWTGSKGPLVAFLSAIAFYLFLEKRLGVLLLTGVLSCSAFFLAAEFGYLPERLLVVQRVISNDLSNSDFGSIGSRQAMFAQSLNIFQLNPLLGIGISNWSSHLSDTYLESHGFVYPHSVLSEVLSEYGIIGVVLFSSLLISIYRLSNNLGRSIIFFSLIALLFTGDMAYWRFMVFFPLVFFREL